MHASALAMSAYIYNKCHCLRKHSSSINHGILLKEGFPCDLQVDRHSGRIIAVRDSSVFDVFRAEVCIVDLLCDSDRHTFEEMLSFVEDDHFQASLLTFTYQAGGLAYCLKCKVVPFAYDLIAGNVSICIQYMSEPHLMPDGDREPVSEKAHAASRSTFVDLEGKKFHELHEDASGRTEKSFDSVVDFTMNELLDMLLLEDLHLQTGVARDALETAADEYDKLSAALSSTRDKMKLRQTALSCFRACERAAMEDIEEELDGLSYRVKDARDKMDMRTLEANLQDSFRDLLAQRVQQLLSAASVMRQLVDVDQHVISYLLRCPLPRSSVRRVAMGRMARQVLQAEAEIRD
eukprot:TRINITY_DN16896_c0_g1_i1.p1 TRINITY_DN16896_c0_g1~~TRINITY_DN16896_c0_g1_i1.p1  ORF type:complete len:349 (-),score=75.61 TRINITY_DN16896_c0_g1_i1:44-1090(-)